MSGVTRGVIARSGAVLLPYLIKVGNVRHEHEYKVWRDVKLPAGKISIPGVVSHATDLAEHPDRVADRINMFAELVRQR